MRKFMIGLTSAALALWIVGGLARAQTAPQTGLVGQTPVVATRLDTNVFKTIPAGSPCKMYTGSKARLVRVIDGGNVLVKVQFTAAQASARLEQAKKKVAGNVVPADRPCGVAGYHVVKSDDWTAMGAAGVKATADAKAAADAKREAAKAPAKK